MKLCQHTCQPCHLDPQLLAECVSPLCILLCHKGLQGCNIHCMHQWLTLTEGCALALRLLLGKQPQQRKLCTREADAAAGGMRNSVPQDGWVLVDDMLVCWLAVAAPAGC